MERLVWNEGSCYPFFIYTADFKEKATGSTRTSYIGMLSSLDVNGKVYDDVAVFTISDDASWNWEGDPSRYYWASSVGIIKRENLRTGEEWDLVDYDVKQ